MDKRTPKAVDEVLLSGYIGQGKKVDEFERELQDILKFDFGVTLNSATSALSLALHLIGVGPGDAVISTPMTCSATNEVITLAGAKIIWADVNEYGNIDQNDVANKLQYIQTFHPKEARKIKAIMAVDWGGLPCDYEELRKCGLPIIEDAAHAYGATYKNAPISRTGGDFVAFSFQAIKHLTTGDGGLLVVPEKEYSRAKLLRWYGLDRETGLDAMRCKLDIKEAGYKYHMNDISATIGLGNIAGSRWVIAKHKENAKYYDRAFAEMNLLPEWPKDRQSTNWLYTIHVNNPDRFEQFMREHGVMVSQVHNRNDNYSCFKKFKSPLPNLDEFFKTMSCIPVGWWLDDDERKLIVESVKEYVETYPC